MARSEMRPILAANNIAHRALMNAKQPGDIFLHRAIGAKAANFAYLIFGQSCMGVLFASLVQPHRLIVASLLCAHVLHIVAAGSGKEMLRVTAGWIIALVTDFLIVSYRAIVQFVGKAMGRMKRLSLAESAIACSVLGTSPKPALRQKNRMDGAILVNLFPEAIFERAASVVIVDESLRLTFNPAPSFVVSLRNWCGLTTAALTVAYGDFIERKLGLNMFWGMLGAHKKFTFLVSKPRTFARRWATSIGVLLVYYSTFGRVGVA